jgi:Skp family chaperone for outer membrane proteins
MNIYCVDYDKVAIRYKTYIEKASELDNLKLKHFQEMEGYKKEMEALVESSKSGLIVDDMTKRINAEKFKALQNKAMTKENNIRAEYQEKQADLMESCFVEISAIIDEYITLNPDKNIDIVINKEQIFYSSGKCELTDEIIELTKQKGLYIELTEAV